MTKMKSALCLATAAILFSACSDGSSSSSDDGSSSSGVISSSSADSAASSSSSFVEKASIGAAALVKRMGVGINMGNIFEAPDEGSWGETFSDEGVKALADSGFTNIRIPVRWDTHLSDSTATGCTVDSAWMARITHAVNIVTQNGMIAVIDSHHWADMYTDPAGQEPCYLDVYRQMMEHFKTYSPDSLVIELLNEPREKLSGTTLTSLIDTTIKVIRAISPNRVIMIGGGNWNSYTGLTALTLPDSVKNIIATFHYYEPMNFTHQGATFTEPQYPTGTLWTATSAQQSAVTTAFAKVKAWSDKNNIPVYLGEFGAYEMADSASRALWTEFVRTTATSNGFACAYWEFSSGFGVYDNDKDPGVWHEYLMSALLRPSVDFTKITNYPSLDTVGYVLFDDFDSYTGKYINLNAISGKIATQKGSLDSGNGYWYVYNDSLSRAFNISGDTIITSTLINYEKLDTSTYKTNFSTLISNKGATGNGLYAKFHLKGDSYPWVGFGSSFDGSKTFDMTNLKALTFKVKGYGTFMVSWGMNYDKISSVAGDWGKFQTSIELTSEWKTDTIWFDQWVPTPYSQLETDGAKWADNDKAVFYLQFANGQNYGESADDSLEIYLDDIRFYGMSDSDFGISK